MSKNHPELDETAKQLSWLFEAARETSIFSIEHKYNLTSYPSAERYCLTLRNRLGLAVRSIVSLHAIIESLLVAREMSRRFPWHSTRIKKSQHLRATRFLFLNTCYLYETRVKLFANTLNAASIALLGRKVTEPAKLIRTAKNGLHSHIRERGELFHNWERPYEPIDFYSMVELIEEIGWKPSEPIDLPSEARLLYSAAKKQLYDEICDAIEFARSDYEGICREHKACILECFELFRTIEDLAQRAPERLDALVLAKVKKT